MDNYRAEPLVPYKEGMTQGGQLPASVPPDAASSGGTEADRDERRLGACGNSDTLAPPAVAGFATSRLLGRGGTSAVWLVTDATGQRFALKVLSAVVERPVSAGRPPTLERSSNPEAFGGSTVHSALDPSALPGRRARRDAPSVGAMMLPPRSAGSTPGRAAHGSSARDHRDGTGVSSNSEGADALTRELRLLQRLRHEHLVRVHRIVVTDQGPALVMDLAAGGSLLGLLTTRGPLPIAEVVTTLVPIAQALSHLHEAGAVHGDVSPGNILFSHEGKPLLSDFGTAKLLGADPSTMSGTPGFIDPSSTGAFDPGGDVFALAAVSWFALTGRIPGPTDQRPPLALIVPDVPDELMQLIEDGLSSSRDRRPTASSFARRMLPIATPEPVDLVPAVHSSVLPELLTRRSASQPIAASTRRGKRSAPSRMKRQKGTGAARPRSGRAAEQSAEYTNRARTRRTLALTSGTVAVFLLVAGLALTIGRSGGSETLVAEPAVQDVPSASAVPAEAPVREEASADPQPQDERSADPVEVLGQLVERRAVAFGTADPEVLRDVDVEGSPAMNADEEAVSALEQAGQRLRDLSITLQEPRSVAEAEVTADAALAVLPGVAEPPEGVDVAVIRASARISSYTTDSAAQPEGAEVDVETEGGNTGSTSRMAAGTQELVFVLWNTSDGWRIHTVVGP